MLNRKPKSLMEIFGQFIEMFEGKQREAIMEFVHDGILVAKDVIAASEPVNTPPNDIPDMRRR